MSQEKVKQRGLDAQSLASVALHWKDWPRATPRGKVNFTVEMNLATEAKLIRLGGTKWILAMIKAARDPMESTEVPTK